MELVLFTEKPLKGLKNTYKIGEEYEKQKSVLFHKKAIPLLISPRLLRSKNLGQIDLAIINNKEVLVFELKKNVMSFQNIESTTQHKRLRDSCDYLRFVTSKDVRLLYYSGL